MIFNAASIVALIFVVFSIAALLAIAFNGNGFFRSPFRKYQIASAAIYVSGTILILLLFLFVVELPMMFVFISEAVILSIFIFTVWIIDRLGKNMDAIRAEMEKNIKKDEIEDI
jgi:hypothetical protein